MPFRPKNQSRGFTPKMRCPACGDLIALPADTCPDCGVVLRNWLPGMPQAQEPSSVIVNSLKMTVKVMLLVGLSVILVKAFWPRDYTKSGTDFQSLAREHPVLLKPYVVVYETRQIIDGANDSLTRRQRIIEAAAKDPARGEVSEEALEYSRRMTPHQRAKTLKELTIIMSQGRDDGAPAYTGPTAPGQRRRMMEEMNTN